MGSTRWPFSMMCDGEDFDGTSKLVKSTVLGFWSTMLKRQEEKLPKELDRFQDSLDLLLWLERPESWISQHDWSCLILFEGLCNVSEMYFAAKKPGYGGQQSQASQIIEQLSSEGQCAKVELPPSPITQLGWKPFSRKSRPTAPSLQLLDHISRRRPMTRDLLEFSEMYLVNSSFTRWPPVMIMKRTVEGAW
ncbi:unnamed protein product [Aureobasidium pullulans]|nr:unnamed protein product [Aureobasidium pullulans]CAD0051902.1 unnamed protein product [Aureobasidium pullulans]